MIPLGISTAMTWLLHMYTLCVVLTAKLKAFPKKSALPNYFVSIILHLVFIFVWAAALVSTDSKVSDMVSTITQYAFAILAVAHALAIFVLTLVRSKDIRKAVTCRSTGKYEITGSPWQPTTMNAAYQLGGSGVSRVGLLHDQGNEEKLPQDEKVSTVHRLVW